MYESKISVYRGRYSGREGEDGHENEVGGGVRGWFGGGLAPLVGGRSEGASMSMGGDMDDVRTSYVPRTLFRDSIDYSRPFILPPFHPPFDRCSFRASSSPPFFPPPAPRMNHRNAPLVLVLTILGTLVTLGYALETVTCGSVIKLVNKGIGSKLLPTEVRGSSWNGT